MPVKADAFGKLAPLHLSPRVTVTGPVGTGVYEYPEPHNRVFFRGQAPADPAARQAYAREILGIKNPRVGILSNGSEEFKGTDLTQQAALLCKNSELNFLGYVEGTDIFSDRVDVVVTDGFVGNIVLKTSEGLGKTILQILKRELTATPLRKMGAMMAKGGFKTLKAKMDPEAHGGARIVGLKGTVVKVHGKASDRVVANAIGQLTDAASQHLNERIAEAIARTRITEPPVVPA